MNMKMNTNVNMIELASGTLELENDRWEHLRRVLEAILPHWIIGTELNGKGIQLFLLQKSKGIKGAFPPVVILRALREGEDDSWPIAGYEQLEEMPNRIHPGLLINHLKQIFNDKTQMEPLWRDEDQCTQPKGKHGAG
jgi:hypothetical protein